MHYFTLSANQNFVYAQLSLGEIYEKGITIKQDIEKSIHYYTLAANLKSEIAQLKLGVIYYMNRNIQKSIQYFLLAANQNNSTAQIFLGLIYYDYDITVRDINKAIYFFQLAADNKSMIAYFYLGEINYTHVKNINKSIYYYKLAANQNHSSSQNNLGMIYYEDKYVPRDISKAIFYFTLAAKQNHVNASAMLGNIYFHGFFVSPNINKAIQYYTIAADRNHMESQYIVGCFYYYNKEINKRDIDKAIHYFTLAAKQNFAYAQLNLGNIYYQGIYTQRDVYKSIYYLELAAKNKCPISQFLLGYIYFIGEYIKKNMEKAYYYFSLAAKHDHPQALFYLGLIYYDGSFVKKDINKAINYFEKAAKQNDTDSFNMLAVIYFPTDKKKSFHYVLLASDRNDPYAQFLVGICYLNGTIIEKNIKKGVNSIFRSASNRCHKALFVCGYLFHEGKYVCQNITESIKFYKEASTFNDCHAKNNLGIIYKNGFGNEISQHFGFAMSYFEDALKIANDKCASYNLSHIYIYVDKSIEKIEKSIKLLIKCIDENSVSLYGLLTIALIIKNRFNFTNIEKDLKMNVGAKSYIIDKVLELVNFLLSDNENFEMFYQLYKTYDYIYDFNLKIIKSNLIQKLEKKEKSNCMNINKDFYEGFGI